MKESKKKIIKNLNFFDKYEKNNTGINNEKFRNINQVLFALL